jgi:hypothetical protein
MELWISIYILTHYMFLKGTIFLHLFEIMDYHIIRTLHGEVFSPKGNFCSKMYFEPTYTQHCLIAQWGHLMSKF